MERNDTATSSKRWDSIRGSDRPGLLFSSHTFQSALLTQELFPPSSTAKLPLISAGARERPFTACTGNGTIDSCRKVLSYKRLFNYLRKTKAFLQIYFLVLSSNWLRAVESSMAGKKTGSKSLTLTIKQLSLYNTRKPLWKEHHDTVTKVLRKSNMTHSCSVYRKWAQRAQTQICPSLSIISFFAYFAHSTSDILPQAFPSLSGMHFFTHLQNATNKGTMKKGPCLP